MIYVYEWHGVENERAQGLKITPFKNVEHALEYQEMCNSLERTDAIWYYATVVDDLEKSVDIPRRPW